MEERVEYLQHQMQETQDTLQGLLHACQLPAGVMDTGKPATKHARCHPDELSLVASETWDEGEDPPRMDLEDLLDSELDEDTSQASEPASLDPSDRAVISRAAERAQMPVSAVPTTSVFDRGSLNVRNQKDYQSFLILWRSYSPLGRHLALLLYPRSS